MVCVLVRATFDPTSHWLFGLIEAIFHGDPGGAGMLLSVGQPDVFKREALPSSPHHLAHTAHTLSYSQAMIEAKNVDRMERPSLTRRSRLHPHTTLALCRHSESLWAICESKAFQGEDSHKRAQANGGRRREVEGSSSMRPAKISVISLTCYDWSSLSPFFSPPSPVPWLHSHSSTLARSLSLSLVFSRFPVFKATIERQGEKKRERE